MYKQTWRSIFFCSVMQITLCSCTSHVVLIDVSYTVVAATVHLLGSLYFVYAVQGPAFFLEDGRSAVSVNEALMWAIVTPFSPLGSGARINPF